jgi:hypothetical protein
MGNSSTNPINKFLIFIIINIDMEQIGEVLKEDMHKIEEDSKK